MRHLADEAHQLVGEAGLVVVPDDELDLRAVHGLPVQAGQWHLRGRPRHRVPVRVPRGGRGRVRRVLLRAVWQQGLGRGQDGKSGGAGEKAGGENLVVGTLY